MFNSTSETITALIVVYVLGYMQSAMGFILDDLQERIKDRRKKKKEKEKEEKDECNT